MSDAPRKQVRLSFPPHIARAIDEGKAAAEKASGVKLTDAQYLLSLLESEVERRKKRK